LRCSAIDGNVNANQGRNDLLDEYLGNGGASSGGWHIGLIDNAGFSAANAADTPASHPG
jgi:hypothetical protein